MTAPTKMTEERAREIINQEYDSRMTARECWTAGEARGFLEGLQAGRAEMAEEAAKLLEEQECKCEGLVNSAHDDDCIVIFPWVKIRALAQRNGGKENVR